LRHFRQTIQADSPFEDLLSILSNVPEYSELPVRCNEDLLNREIEKDVVYPVQSMDSYISPHVKAYVLMQAHFARLPLPISDYITDQITVLDSAIRFCQVTYPFYAIHHSILMELSTKHSFCYRL
jgi:hypothetical protein